MARLYQAGDEDSTCPGEASCDVFKSSAEDSPVRCPSCPKRTDRRPQTDDGRNDDGQPSTVGGPESWDERMLLDRVERFRRERDSGRQIYQVVSPEEWEALLIYDDVYADYRRGFEIRMVQGFAMMGALLTQR